MLQFIRDRAQGVLVWTIVGLIIITFALFGLSGYLDGSSKNNIAEVNGVEISDNEYRREFQNYQERLRQMLGENYRPDLFNPAMIKNEVINKLVMRELLTQYLDDKNFHIAHSRIFSELKSIEAFKGESGEFDPKRYRELIRRQGMSEGYFEQQVARDVSARYLTSGISQSEFATGFETRHKQRLDNQQREIGYLQLDRNTYLKNAKASADEVKAYYDSHQQEFLTPEQVSIEYVELKLEDLAKRFDVSEQDIKNQYKTHRLNFVESPEQRKASHILIQVNNKTTEEAAKKKMADIQKQIAAGKSFAELAKQHSEDPGSARKGGDLGFFGKGVMDKAFEETTFKLKKGELSKPVRSTFGFHLIKLVDIKPEKIKPLKLVHDQIKREMQTQQAQQSFFNDTETMKNTAFDQDDSLQPVAKALDSKLKKTGLFGRNGGSGITANPKVTSAAFSEDVLSARRNSSLIEISDTHMLVLRIKEHKPAAQKPLQAVKALIENRLKTEAASRQVATDTSQALKRLQNGESPQKVAAALKGAKWQKVGLVSRSSANDKSAKAKKLPNDVRRYSFSLARPQSGKITWSSTVSGTGNGLIVGLYLVKENKGKDDKAQLAQEKQRLIQRQGSAMLNQFMAQMRKEATVAINSPAADQPQQ